MTHFPWRPACFCFHKSCHPRSGHRTPVLAKLGRDGRLCLRGGWGTGTERGGTAPDIQGYSSDCFFTASPPFPSPSPSARHTPVYQAPSVCGLRRGCLLLPKHLLYKLNESGGLLWEEYSQCPEGISYSFIQRVRLISLFYLALIWHWLYWFYKFRSKAPISISVWTTMQQLYKVSIDHSGVGVLLSLPVMLELT